MFPFDFSINGDVSPALFLLLAAMTLVNFGMAIFWIFVGWRALRAHERLPDALRGTLAPRSPASGVPPAD